MRLDMKMNPKDYSNWYSKTGVKTYEYSTVIAIYKLQNKDRTVPNLEIAKIVKMTAVRIGQITNKFKADGILEDRSAHPLRRDWHLTPLGEELAEFILANMEVKSE